MPGNFYNIVNDSLDRLHQYVLNEDYSGWDLFDGLNSRLLHKSGLYKIPAIRLAWIQAFKRSPINFRRIAQVPKGNNSKGIALFISGLLQSGLIDEAEQLLTQLYDQTIYRNAGNAWGYNFPWESRAFYAPAGTPNIVSTVFVANTLLDYFDISRDQKALDAAKAAVDFIIDELILFEDESTLCFGYIPGETARVHNASMMAAALMGRLSAIGSDYVYYKISLKAMTYAIKAINPDNSWPYGERHHHQFVDNFHTGFNLVALNSWMNSTGKYDWLPQLRGAYDYFIENFWLPDGCPKYYNNSLYPIDIHCSAQGIVTCVQLADLDVRSGDLVQKITNWAISNMQDKRGYFYYQKKRYWKNKIPYIRWSQAWMFYALSMLLASRSENYSAKK